MTSTNLHLEPLGIGQIRKLRPNKRDGASRLVLIAEQDHKDDTYLVFLLNNVAEAAIPRDLCLAKGFTSANYDLVLMTEYFSRANPENFDVGTIIGHVNLEQLEHIRNIAFNNPFGNLPDEITSDGVRIGGFPMQKYDSVWHYRTAEFDNFQNLTYVRDINSTDYSWRFLKKNPKLLDPELIDEYPLDVLFALSRSGERVAA